VDVVYIALGWRDRTSCGNGETCHQSEGHSNSAS